MQNFTMRMQQLLVLGVVLLCSQALNAQLTNPRGSQISLTAADGTTTNVAASNATFGSTRDLYCGGMTEGESALNVTPAEGCEEITDDLTGKVAFIDRGTCALDLKVLNAQTAGAVAVVICNNSDEALFALRPGDVGDQVAIPSYLISQSDCATLRTAGDGMVTIAGLPPVFDSRDNVIWGADGEGSFTGGAGDWMVVDYLDCPNAPDGFTLWQWDAEGTAYTGAYAGNAAAINSPTACTGTMVFNSDFFDNAGTPGNFGNGDCAANQLGALISPSMDLSSVSAEAGLAVKFYQGIRQFQSSHYLGWSIDGGMTWDSLLINDDLEVNSTLISRTERVRLPAVVNGQSDVRIKFTMNGNYYYWIVDDVQIVEREQFNLAVNPFYAIAPNAITPANQVTSFGFLADILNKGTAEQNDVVLDVAIVNQNLDVLYENSFNYGNVPSDSLVENQLFEGTYTPSTDVGTYRGTYTLSSENEDFDPSDNEESFFFAVSDSTFAKAFESTRSIAPAGDNSYAYGNCYYVPNGEGNYARFVSFGVSNAEDLVGLETTILLYKWQGDLNDDLIANVDEYDGIPIAFNSYTFDGTESNTLLTLPISLEEEGIALENDSYYFIVAQFDAPDEDTDMFLLGSDALDYNAMRLAASLNEDEPAQYASVLDVGNSGEFGLVGFGWNLVPIMQLHLGSSPDLTVNVEEALASENKVTLYPNPATSELNVNFDLVEATKTVTLRVTDATGRVISQSPLQNIQRNTFTFDVSNLANGVYYMDIITEAGHRTERFVVTK